jgi:hypothetical protein
VPVAADMPLDVVQRLLGHASLIDPRRSLALSESSDRYQILKCHSLPLHLLLHAASRLIKVRHRRWTQHRTQTSSIKALRS